MLLEFRGLLPRHSQWGAGFTLSSCLLPPLRPPSPVLLLLPGWSPDDEAARRTCNFPLMQIPERPGYPFLWLSRADRGLANPVVSGLGQTQRVFVVTGAPCKAQTRGLSTTERGSRGGDL